MKKYCQICGRLFNSYKGRDNLCPHCKISEYNRLKKNGKEEKEEKEEIILEVLEEEEKTPEV